MRKLYFVVLMLISGFTYGQTFSSTYDFALVTNSSGTTDPTPPPTAAGLTFGSFTAVGTPVNPNAGGRFSFTDWSTTVVNTAEYYQVTLTPAVNYSIDLNTIVFRIQRSATGIRHYSVRSDIDAYAANQPASINPVNAALSVIATDVFEITDIATAQDGSTITLGTGFDNLTAPVTFRFYGFDAEAAGGTFSIDNVTFNGVATFSGVVTDYFSKPVGNLTDVATWGTSTDGTGTSPTNFTTDGQEFNVVNRVSTTLDANWIVSGAASKVIVGDGVTGTELILPNTAALTGTVDVTNLSTLRLENSTLPTFGTLATGSTVNYAQTITPYTVPTGGTYSNLSITNGVKILNTGTITVNGNLVLDGVTNFNGSASPFSTINLAGNFTMQNAATFEAVVTGDANRMTFIPTGTTTQTLSGGDFYFFRIQTPNTGSTTVNVALSGANVFLGNNTSGAGGLDMRQATHTLSIGAGNTLTIRGAGCFLSTNLATISGTATSDLTIDKTAGTNNIGTIGFTAGSQQLNDLSYNCSSGTSQTLTLASPLSLSGNLSMSAGHIALGANSLDVTGVVVAGSTSYVVTNGIGVLTRNGIGITGALFPIGFNNTTYNPVTLANGSSNNFSARVANAILDPSGSIPVDAVLRTWYIGANVNTAGVTVTYQYATADCSAGASAQPLTMEILQSDYTTWHLSAGNGVILALGADPAWTVTSAATLNISNSLIPYTLGVSGTAILAVDYFITAKAQKQNNNALISWTVGNAAGVNNFEVQRSVGNGAYQTIGTVAASSGQVNYQFTDFATDKGTNLYRIRVNRLAGGVRYSNTVAVINGSNGLLITGLWPNPAQDKAQLNLSTAKAGAIRFEIYGLNGVMVKSWTAAAAEGTNIITIATGDLRAGVYQLVATGQEAKSVFRFIKQ